MPNSEERVIRGLVFEAWRSLKNQRRGKHSKIQSARRFEGRTEIDSTLPPEIISQDFKGGGLIDDVLLMFRFFSSFPELFGSSDSRESFVEKG